MKKATQNIQNQKTTVKVLLMVLFVLLFFNVKMSAQNVVKAESDVVVEITVAADDSTVASAAESNSSLNMVSWFMGSKQTPKATISNDGAVSNKKQLINAGIAPNRLLMKAFMKKAANYQSTIA